MRILQGQETPKAKPEWASVYPQSSLVIFNPTGTFGMCASVRIGSKMLLRNIRESHIKARCFKWVFLFVFYTFRLFFVIVNIMCHF